MSRSDRRTLAAAALARRALAAAAFLAAVPVAAQDETRVLERELDVGSGYVSDDSYRFGKYTGLGERGFVPVIGLRLQTRPVWDSGEVFFGRLEAAQLGAASTLLEGALGEHGRQRLRVGFQSVPRYRSRETVTPFVLPAAGFHALPPGWQAEDNTTAGLLRLDDSLRAAPLRERRRRLLLDYERVLQHPWRVSASWRHDRRTGRQVVGASAGNTGGNARAALLPAALDWQSDVFDFAVTHHAERHSIRAAYSASFFRNDQAALSWQIPFGPHPQWAAGVGFPDGLGRLARAPDNDFHQLAFSGGYTFTATTRVGWSLHHGRMRQNQAFLPYTVNPQLAVEAPLPRESLDARIDTTRVNLDLSTRPLTALQLQARYRLDERNNRTPRDVYRPVPGDAQPQVAPEQARLNRPYGLSQHRIATSANYRLPRAWRVHGGYDFTHTERDYAEIRRAREHTWRAGVRHTGGGVAAFGLDYAFQRRNVGDYVGTRSLEATRPPGTVGEDDFENHPLLRKYALADRDRDRISLRADLFPDPRISLGAAIAWHRDDYRNSVFGLNRATLRSFTLDAGYSPGDDIRLGAFVSLDRYAAAQSARQFNNTPAQAADPDRDWWVDSSDRFRTLGLDLDLQHLAQHLPAVERIGLTAPLDLGVEWQYARSRGVLDVTSGPALTTEPLPDLYSRLVRYRLHATYRLSARDAVRTAWTHERYTSRDFALDPATPGTMASVIALGEQSPRYSLHWITLSYSRSF